MNRNTKKWMLLEPIKVGTVWLRNRIVMSPMENRLNRPDGSANKRLIDYYSERAKGGVGAIIVQHSYVDDKKSRSGVCQLGVYSDHLMPALNELAEAVKANGAAILHQIGHGGRQRHPKTSQLVAPSAIPCDFIGIVPKELTLAEIEEIQEAFAEAARRLKVAGYDGVEIHGAHGYLMNQFLSPRSNRRTDKYGGQLQNRALFALETIQKIRQKVGNQFIVGYRMSADEYIPGGLTLEETSRFAKMLEDAEVSYVHVSAGVYESLHHTIPPIYIERAHLVHLAEGIKKAIKVPVVTVGGHDVYSAEEALHKGKADLVAFGRPLLADPELPNKLALGRLDDIRPCIKGNIPCATGFFLLQSIKCEVNPACGREREFAITPATTKKNVMVVGGGIAGLEAARVAALRGHKVTMVEKEEQLGGHLIEASAPKFKQRLGQLLVWATKQVYKVGVKVQLNTEATTSLVKKLRPEVLILAVGSDFIVPPVPGIEKTSVVMPDDVLLGLKKLGLEVVVIGGGIVGCETALHVAEELKKRVTIIARGDEILLELEPLSKTALKERLQAAGVEIHTGWNLKEITDTGIVCESKNWEVHKVPADTVIIAKGLMSRGELVEKFKGLAPEVYVIGDCAEARNVYHAFKDAWHAVFKT